MDRTWRRESSGCTGRCSKAAIGRSRRGAATILKADGSKRALGIAALEDKIVQHALATVLGGLDTLIFTAGIGENAAPIRKRICGGMEFLGILLDPRRNQRNEPIIT